MAAIHISVVMRYYFLVIIFHESLYPQNKLYPIFTVTVFKHVDFPL